MAEKITTTINGERYYVCPKCNSSHIGIQQIDKQYGFGCFTCGFKLRLAVNRDVTPAFFRREWNNAYKRYQLLRDGKEKGLIQNTSETKTKNRFSRPAYTISTTETAYLVKGNYNKDFIAAARQAGATWKTYLKAWSFGKSQFDRSDVVKLVLEGYEKMDPQNEWYKFLVQHPSFVEVYSGFHGKTPEEYADLLTFLEFFISCDLKQQKVILDFWKLLGTPLPQNDK